MRFAEVAVDAPAGHSRTFSYSIPQSLDVQPGQLARVPFGSRTLQGIVFALVDAPQVPQTRDILEITNPEPLLDDTRLQLAGWISDYYMSSLFDAAAPTLPPGGRIRVRTYLSLADVEIDHDSLTPFQQRVVQYLRSRGSVEQERLFKIFGEGARSSINSLASKKIVTRAVSSRSAGVGRKFQELVRLGGDKRAAIAEWLPEVEGKAPRQAGLITRLLEESALDIADARKQYGASAVNALLEKGWLRKESVPIDRDPLAGMSFPASPPVTLTRRQQEVASRIRATLEDAAAMPRAYLVQGVTGSGKTEIYLDAAARCLELGKTAIVLVPEIALTHQTIERFASRFPGRVAVLHSGLSAGERFDQWWKIKQGEYGIVIGSRSAVFAPQPDLGLIVIDEEHEWTYKQHDASPRYHARDVALKLSALTGAVVVMGSASPDVASYYKGLRKEFNLLTLPHRVSSRSVLPLAKGEPEGVAAMASVEIVDMRQELREGSADIFSRALLSAMDDCLEANNQMVLFLNRRGSSSYMQCRNCGYTLKCSRCDVSLTYHRGPDRLICHYCGLRRVPPENCPECLRYRMSFYGVGTEAVAEEVRRRFPDAKVIRWDRDTTKGPKSYEELLAQFRSGEAQALVGTQMIAKGLHFPAVTLVGVVSADVGLGIPDYRAGERAFQLLCQVEGRAGRGPSPGRVIVQTFQPENYAIQAAASQDYQRFYTKEMAYRREQANPPFTKLIHLMRSHKNLAACEQEALDFAKALQQKRDEWGYSDTEILGPTPAFPARLRGHYRWRLILRGPEPRKLLDKATIPSGWLVDVDPVALT